MIDFDLEMKNTQPLDMDNIESNEYSVDTDIKKSIILYNKAIAEIKINDLDSAIKDLRKALSYNEDFTEAIRLLGLCYINNKKYKKAENTFKELAEYEEYSDLAKEYIRNSIVERTMAKTVKPIKEKEDSSSKNIDDNRNKKVVMGISILSVLIAIFTISFIIGINIPSASKQELAANKTKNLADKKTNKSSDENNNEDMSNTVSSDITKKNTTETTEQLDNTSSQEDDNDNSSLSNTTEKSYKDENINNTQNIKNTDANDKSKNKTKEVKSDDKPKSNTDVKNKWDIYNEGNRLYKQGKYKQALPKLKEAYEIRPSEELMPWITYQIGNAYKETGDNANALAFFQKVKEDYPNSGYVSSADRGIKQIEKEMSGKDND
ncbi:tetratricopeptide repeat protein [Clostridium sp.]|uniref:tetratricopeptide repeat protein n=1 Tax=Clostridium sp. TaxID=1506 RepID=UPI0039F561D8